MKIGLVLEGGAMRGMYTAGVIDVLLEENIKADVIIGVSAGALFGINYKSRQKGRALRSNINYVNDKRYMSLYNLVTTGNLVNEDFCFNEIPNILDDFNYSSFKRSKGDFYAVVTNIKTGKAEYMKIEDCKKDIQALRASGSMPFVSKPVEINGNYYLDGGVADPIPIDKMMSMGVDKVIVVLTRPKNYRKKRINVYPSKIMYGKYPKFILAMKNRYKVYNDTLDKIKFLEDMNKIFVVRPSKLINIKKVEKDEEKLKSMYDLGYNDLKSRIPELKEYLK